MQLNDFPSVKRIILSAGLLLSAAACATGPAYHPAGPGGTSGFSETKLDGTHYRVAFQGDTHTPRHKVEDYLLRRSAELTIQEGFSYFHIDEKSLDADRTIVTSIRPAFYGGLHRYHNHDRFEFPYYAYGFDWSYPHDSRVREYEKFSAVAYITLSNAKSFGDVRIFKASEIMTNIPVED